MLLRISLKSLSFYLSFLLLLPFCGTAQDADEPAKTNNSSRQHIPEHIYTKDTTYIHKLINMASELRYHHTDSVAILAKKTLQLSKELAYTKGEINSRLLLSASFSDKGDADSAFEQLEKARKLAQENGHMNLEVKILNAMANEYGFNGQYAHSLKSYLDGIELATAADNKPMLSILYENVANVYADQKDYEEALQYFTLVREINDELGNEVFMAETNSNMASVYADMEKLDYAMFHINKSIAVFEKEDIPEWLAYAYEIKGKTYLKDGEFKWALYWYKQAELLQKKLQDDRGKIDLYNGIATAYLGQQEDIIAADYAYKSMALSERINYLEGKQECAKLLYNLSKQNNDLLCALEYHETFKELTDTLSKNKTKMSLELLKARTDYERQKELLINDNDKALAKQRRYINLTLFIILIIGLIAFLMFRGRKIHQQLNIELSAQKEILEQREAQLRENDETKTKLFSIIGHDLRGPIGALQGLLNLYIQDDVSKKEFLGLIPKLRNDIEHISFTLNNLLSWGHTQMNGAITKPGLVTLETIIDDNINLLSEQAAGKKIRISSLLSGNTQSWADANQVDIIVRNLMSNAIKFTPDQGMITINARESNSHWEISVRDTGIGMTEEVRQQLFSENTHASTIGTHNEKGTGLGLSLCKEMVEKNQGQIWVESTPRKGSCFFFTLPKAKEKYKRAS
ncbi:MAG: tetratricopeptide repeat-containing sensor histidine kinase [Eudoraea sp.]|nr:tetratricopeptide repeat-containing sensor histidine kinase [Eudoraea sp.]